MIFSTTSLTHICVTSITNSSLHGHFKISPWSLNSLRRSVSSKSPLPPWARSNLSWERNLLRFSSSSQISTTGMKAHPRSEAARAKCEVTPLPTGSLVCESVKMYLHMFRFRHQVTLMCFLHIFEGFRSGSKSLEEDISELLAQFIISRTSSGQYSSCKIYMEVVVNLTESVRCSVFYYFREFKIPHELCPTIVAQVLLQSCVSQSQASR